MLQIDWNGTSSAAATSESGWVVIYKHFRLYVCVLLLCEICIQYERLYAHKINCASATLRKHEKNKKHIHFEISNTVSSARQLVTIWGQSVDATVAIEHTTQAEATRSCVFCLNNCHRSNISAGICMHTYILVHMLCTCVRVFISFWIFIGAWHSQHIFDVVYAAKNKLFLLLYDLYNCLSSMCACVCVSPSSVKTDPGNWNETVSAAAAVVREFTRNS